MEQISQEVAVQNVFVQIGIGSAIILLTIIVSALLMIFGYYMFHRSRLWDYAGSPYFNVATALVLASVWFIIVLTIVIWIWALAFIYLDIFTSIEEALYFSMVSFTTLGFGDIILEKDWRLLSGFVAADGFILFGVGTAFVIEFMRQLHEHHADQREVNKPPYLS